MGGGRGRVRNNAFEELKTGSIKLESKGILKLNAAGGLSLGGKLGTAKSGRGVKFGGTDRTFHADGSRKNQKFGKTPSGYNHFGEQITGQYGAKVKRDPSTNPAIQTSITRMKREVANERRLIFDQAILNKVVGGETQALTYLEQQWKRLDRDLYDLRNQAALYKNSAIERPQGKRI